MMQFYMRNNVFENNIIYVGKHGRVMTSKSGRMDPNTPTVTMDHNVYYFPGGSGEAKWRFDNQDYASFENYVESTGNDRDFRNERPFQQLVLEHLRPGDIYTHLYLGAVPMLDPEGKVLPYLFEARKRGVIFDVGHGGGSFQWRQAAPAVRQGFVPDSISTDLHVSSMNAGMKDILNVMSKFLTLGMSLEDVVARATWNPAREIHQEELGHLSAGAPADIAVLRLVKGDFGFLDARGTRMNGSQKLVAELTIRAGRVVWDLNGLTADDWHSTPVDSKHN
jgi:hypothetical protein